MADLADDAQTQIDAERDRAQRYRKPVPTVCECGEPCAVLSNGATARFCADCLADFQAAK